MSIRDIDELARNYMFNESEVINNKVINNIVRVKGIKINNKEIDESYSLVNKGASSLLSSLNILNEDLNYYILGNKESNSVEVLFESSKDELLKDTIKSVYPGSDIVSHIHKESLDKKLTYKALVSFVPNVYDDDVTIKLDNFVNSMNGKNYCIKVSINSITKDVIDDIYEGLLKERSKNSKKISVNISTTKSESEGYSYREGTTENSTNSGSAIIVSKQEGRSDSKDSTQSNNTGITTGESYDSKDYNRDEYDELLEIHIKRVKEMRVSGGWQASIMIFAESKYELDLAVSTYSSIFNDKLIEKFNVNYVSKDFSIYDKIRVRDSLSKSHILYGSIPNHVNLYTTKELGYITTPYFEEINGFSIINAPRFNQQENDKKGFSVGKFMDFNKETNVEFILDKDDFNRHVLVAGITGSGKTNTVFSMIKNVDVPFLIIEPAKTEYRVLKSLVKDLRIYTLGREGISPFRLNPFKFDNKNISLQEHIDNLKVIFTAAFTMYASMPNILEQTLVNIYTKKGWSLIDSNNIFCGKEVYEELYPTMEELYAEVEVYINSLGYAQEQNQNIKAALLTRIKSLMTGSKGFMLNTTNSIEIDELLKYPTILELEGLADDDEKALIIGFIMLSIYENLRAKDEGYTNKLKHLIVMEEAHRLFANVSTSQNQELANTKGKAVETLSNILCEIRAYGEGFIIVDQVPTKLAPDVLKNTNTKIIHRLVSKDDCEYIAKSIQIKDDEIDFISKLKIGEALVYNDSLESTTHIKIKFNKDEYEYFNNEKVRDFSKVYNSTIYEENTSHPMAEILLTYSDCKEEIFKISKEFIANIVNEDVYKIREYYYSAYKKYLGIANNNGFMLENNQELFVNDLIIRSSKEIINKSIISNNVMRKCILLNYLEKLIDIIREGNSLENEKVLKAIKINKNKIDIKGVI